MADIAKRTPAIDVRSITFPVTPIIPPDVSYGQKLVPSWGNSVAQCLEDLWVNLQAVGAVSIADPTSAKGDIMVRSATALSRLGVGTDGQLLQADAASPLGVRWALVNASTVGAVPVARQVIAGAGLSGGGALSADVTLTANVLSVAGRTGNVVLAVADVSGAVPNTRSVIAGAGTTGGGALSADVTIAANVTSVFGRTGDVVLSPADITGAGGVPATRQVIAGAGLSGGGALSADVTLTANIPAIQTPWKQAIDGGGFALSNVGAITAASLQSSGDFYVTNTSGDAAKPRFRFGGFQDKFEFILEGTPEAYADIQGGLIESKSGGVKFPDGTVQNSAALPSSRQVLAGYGLTGGGPLSADVTLAQVDDTTNQKIRVGKAGALVGTRREISFTAGVNTAVSVTDDAVNNRVNVDISVTGEGGAVPVPTTRQILTGYGLTGGGDLTTDRTLAVVDNTSVQKVSVQANGTASGTRSILNFKAGTNMSVTAVDTGSQVDVTITSLAQPLTPWTSDVDAAGFGLANARDITTARLRIDAAQGVNGATELRNSDGTLRWKYGKNSTPESGLNAGSEFDILRHDDAGVLLGIPLRILRRVGYVGINLDGTDPQYPLEVNGIIKARSGGVMYPDGTLQTTAAVSGGGQTPWTSNIDAANYQLLNLAGVFDVKGPNAVDRIRAMSADGTKYITLVPESSAGIGTLAYWNASGYGTLRVPHGFIVDGQITQNGPAFEMGNGTQAYIDFHGYDAQSPDNSFRIYADTGQVSMSSAVTGIPLIINTNGGAITFGTSAEKMRLTATGNLLVGTTSEVGVSVSGSVVAEGDLYIRNTPPKSGYFRIDGYNDSLYFVGVTQVNMLQLTYDGNANVTANMQAATFSTTNGSGPLPIALDAIHAPTRHIVRTSGDGHVYINGYYNTNNPEDDGTPVGGVYTCAAGDKFIRRTGIGRFSGSVTPTWANVQSKPAWNSAPNDAVGLAVCLIWKNFGVNHVIFDASQSTSPTGAGVNNTNPVTPWSASYPTLMGWNGSSTYGVRVDSCRYAENVPWSGVASKPDVLYQAYPNPFTVNGKFTISRWVTGLATETTSLEVKNTHGTPDVNWGIVRVTAACNNATAGASQFFVCANADGERFKVAANGDVYMFLGGSLRRLSLSGSNVIVV